MEKFLVVVSLPKNLFKTFVFYIFHNDFFLYFLQDILDYYDTATAPASLENNRIIRKRRLGPRRRLSNIRRKKLQQNQQNQHANRRISKEDLEAMSHFYEKEGVYDYVDPLSINDIFISASSNIADDKYDLSTYDNQDYSNNNNINQPQNQSLTRRVANAIFNPTIFAIIAIPLIIGKGHITLRK